VVALLVALSFVTTAMPAGAAKAPAAEKVTGSITIEHLGRGPDSVPGWAEVELVAFEPTGSHLAHGTFRFDVYTADGTLERSIVADVTDAAIEGAASAAFLGTVVSDIRVGAEHGEEGGCGGHDDGHESGDDTGHGGGGAGGGRSRVGQLIAGRIVDGGSPGWADTVAWKWFPAETVTLDTIPAMSMLCSKVVIGGNLVVHPTG